MKHREKHRGIPLLKIGVTACIVVAVLVLSPAAPRALSSTRGSMALLVSTNGCRTCGPGGVYGYRAVLVDVSGRVDAQTSVAIDTSTSGTSTPVFFGLPRVSLSASRAYLLDAGAIEALSPDGRVSQVARVPHGPGLAVAFAVSTDDRRIAVGILSYGPHQTPHTRLYIEDIGGGHHVELFSSNDAYEWPVLWRRDALVLAVSPLDHNQYPAANPYAAYAGYHVVDPTNARRLATMCADPLGNGRQVAVGPLVPAGALCEQQAPERAWNVVSWTGVTRPVAGPAALDAVLSPDGSRLVVTTDVQGHLALQNAAGVRAALKAGGTPLGWIDATHVIVATDVGSPARYVVLDLVSRHQEPIALTGEDLTFVGAF